MFFSDCSVSQLAEFMERAQPSCLSKPSSIKNIALGPRCGNALLDPGEECDCGTVEVKLSVEANGTGCNILVIIGTLESLNISFGEGKYHLGLVWFPVCEVTANKRDGSGDSGHLKLEFGLKH